jgi:hypothetical protein
VADATKAMGLHQTKYYRIVESGRAWPTEEWARRFVHWAWRNESFAKRPMSPLVTHSRKAGNEAVIQVIFDDKDTYKALHKKARDLGVSMSTLAICAMRSYLEEGRYVTTTAQLIREAERLRIESILQHNPSIITILDGDPLLARFIHRTEAETDAPAPLLEPGISNESSIARIIAHPENAEGPASEILTPYLERLLEI